jgi:DNA-binding Xre family transcriptional regulator
MLYSAIVPTPDERLRAALRHLFTVLDEYPSQTEIAHRMQVSQATVSRLRTGQMRMSLSYFLRMCDALDLSPGDLLGRADDEGALSWLRLWSHMTPPTREQALAIIRLLVQAQHPPA